VPYLLSCEGVADVHSSAAAGCAHSLFIDRDGQLLRCGDDLEGDTTPRAFPSLGITRFQAVSSSNWVRLSLALSEQGVVYLWGSLREGIPDADEDSDASPSNEEEPQPSQPQIGSGLHAVTVRGIAAGAHHCAVATADGALYTWALSEDDWRPRGLGYENNEEQFTTLTPRCVRGELN
jgi:alpha-tubulin suppressor-like RCC1 family protein